MSRVYTAPIESVTTSASGDLWQLATDSSTIIRLLEWEITSTATAAEDLEIKIVRASTAGSGGTAMDENPVETKNTVTSGVTALAANSTPAATLTDLEWYAWEQLGPLGRKYNEKTGIIVPISGVIACVLLTTPTQFELNGHITWEEF